MKTLTIASIPMLLIAQEAYEHMVVNLSTEAPFVIDAKKRAKLLEKRQKAMDMVEHIKQVINNNTDDDV